jgi:hypothetical protein
MRAGGSHCSVILTPSGASASSMALVSPDGATSAPPSPTLGGSLADEPAQGQVEQRHQALAAGQDPGFVAESGEQIERLGQRLGCAVLERWWLHDASRLDRWRISGSSSGWSEVIDAPEQ